MNQNPRDWVDRFLAEVFQALAVLLRHPEAAPQIRGSIRRFVLQSFPTASCTGRPERSAFEFWPLHIRSVILSTGSVASNPD